MYDGYKLLLSTMCFEYNVFLRLGCILKYAVEMQGKYIYLEIVKQFSESVHLDDTNASYLPMSLMHENSSVQEILQVHT